MTLLAAVSFVRPHCLPLVLVQCKCSSVSTVLISICVQARPSGWTYQCQGAGLLYYFQILSDYKTSRDKDVAKKEAQEFLLTWKTVLARTRSVTCSRA